MKAIHNLIDKTDYGSTVVISDSKILKLKAIHNIGYSFDGIEIVVISDSKILKLKAIHNEPVVASLLGVLLSVVQRY